MDRETLVRHQALWVRESNSYGAELTRLTVEEQGVYSELRYNRLGDQGKAGAGACSIRVGGTGDRQPGVKTLDRLFLRRG